MLTEGQRRALRGDPDMSDSNRRSQRHRLDNQFKKLREEVQFLNEHSEKYAAWLREIVCRDTTPPDQRESERSRRLEEVEEMKEQIDNAESSLQSIRERLDELETSLETENDGVSEGDGSED